MPNVDHSDAYYLTSDIDWFCCINGVNIHVASMGRKVPKAIEQNLDSIYEQVSRIPMADLNENYWFNRMIPEQWLMINEPVEVARYLCSFSVMARKGFYSFAPITLDPTDEDYYLMAKPDPAVPSPGIDGIWSIELPDLRLDAIDAFQPVPLVRYIEERLVDKNVTPRID